MVSNNAPATFAHEGVNIDFTPTGAFAASDVIVQRDLVGVTYVRNDERIAVPATIGGWFLPLTPSTDGRGVFQDPTHVSFWNSNSFWYYTRPEQVQFIHSPVLFEANRVKNFFPTDWHREHQIVYVKADLVKR